MDGIHDLDPGDDVRLCQRQKRGRSAYERSFRPNIRRVISIARRYDTIAREVKIGSNTEGIVGLSRSIELFDPTGGYKFSTLSFNWIRQLNSRSFIHLNRSICLSVKARSGCAGLARGFRCAKQSSAVFQFCKGWLSTCNSLCRRLRPA